MCHSTVLKNQVGSAQTFGRSGATRAPLVRRSAPARPPPKRRSRRRSPMHQPTSSVRQHQMPLRMRGAQGSCQGANKAEGPWMWMPPPPPPAGALKRCSRAPRRDTLPTGDPLCGAVRARIACCVHRRPYGRTDRAGHLSAQTQPYRTCACQSKRWPTVRVQARPGELPARMTCPCCTLSSSLSLPHRAACEGELLHDEAVSSEVAERPDACASPMLPGLSILRRGRAQGKSGDNSHRILGSP